MEYVRLVRLLAAGLVGVALASAARADEVYVTTYSQLVSAVQTAPAGGRTVTVAPGTYNQSGSLWIYDKSNLTIQGATGNPNDVLIVGLGINNSSQSHNIAIDTCPNFTIQHLTLKNTYYHAIQVNADADFDGDGQITVFDVIDVTGNFGRSIQ